MTNKFRVRKYNFLIFVTICTIVFCYAFFVADDLSEPANMHLNQTTDYPEASHLMYDDGITPEAYWFLKELGLINPGEDGKAVELPKNLSEEVQRQIKDGYDNYGFNAFVSSLISLNRNIPDVRSDVCKNKTYTNLPKASIVILFHNEHLSLLLRTVHSVINRSPPQLIEEILLVDDSSDKEPLGKYLEDYVRRHPKLRLVRSHRRLGIIASRNLGAVNAVGPILIYVDCHIEVTPGWLDPLLDRFTENKNVVVWPMLSGTNADNLEVKTNTYEPSYVGGIKWNLDFKWISIKEYEGDHPTGIWDPKPSPTACFGLLAISKEFYMHLGKLDPDFDIWGGEDVELSIKTWMCGGKIEYVPCSKVYHVYKEHKYKTPKSEKGGYRWNTDRIAEVWLDEYKRYYYRTVGDTKDRNFGDISERVEIRKNIGCKSFKWFIENVYPNVEIPDNIKDTTSVPQDVTTTVSKDLNV